MCPYHVNTNFFQGIFIYFIYLKAQEILLCSFLKLLGFEMDSFAWASVAKNDPEKLAHSITEGILMDKELIGYPKVQFYLFLAIKK